MDWKMGVRRVLAGLLGLSGLTFFLQGIGVFTAVDSFMNNNITWAIIGIVLVIGAMLLWTWGEEQN